MNVLIHNDGKNKRNSYEARLSDLALCGFGATQEEAIADLKRLVQGLVASLRNINYDEVTIVDWDNQPLKSGAV
jgi:hypothetical protein